MGALKEIDAQRGQIDEEQLDRVEAIINSMTAAERRQHQVINGSRRKRIARGSGTSVEEVNRLLKQFVQMRKMLKVGGRQVARLRPRQEGERGRRQARSAETSGSMMKPVR